MATVIYSIKNNFFEEANEQIQQELKGNDWRKVQT